MKPAVDRALFRGVGYALLIEGVLGALLVGFLCAGCASPTAPRGAVQSDSGYVLVERPKDVAWRADTAPHGRGVGDSTIFYVCDTICQHKIGWIP